MIAGEHSGDLLGAPLIKELKLSDRKMKFFGVGGPAMISEGFESLEDMENLSVIGFSQIVSKYGFLKKLLNRIVDEAIKRKTEFAILIDYPGFNLQLAKALKEKGIKVFFYVSPQIWAWRFKRIFFIKKYIDLMLVLFEFEKKIYDEYGVPSEFVGHPLAKRISEKLHSEEKIKFKTDCIRICVMPGSRTSEIKRILPVIMKFIPMLHKEITSQNKKIQFLLPNINKNAEEKIQFEIEKLKREYPEIEVLYFFDLSLRCIQASDLVIVASGTATLEVAYFEKPMVILYKVSLLTYLIGSSVIKVPWIGLVNILGGEEICQELLQAECKPEYVKEEVLNILDKPKYRNTMIEKIQKVKKSLGSGDSSKKSASAILKRMNFLL
ncbi:MAG: lipid-A-disaccharide synthase [Leptospiraceae bacterium]|nr:lipid-A-disaccharide synthase [Leptospiraceae bacterium]NUM42531.1 lipid-A-disaccharide synthase [Leptospiraceae bacterium]